MNASSGQLAGVPTQSGSVTISLQVIDSGSPMQTASKSFSVTISAAVSPVSITTSSLASGQVGTAYSATATATGGTTPYSWSITSGSLPNGLSLNSSTGQISGTPTVAGSFSLTVQVTDSSVPAQVASKSLTITTAAGVPSGLQLTTTTLPNGQVNVPYSATLSALGGTTPYQWSLLTGSLPPGLSLSVSAGQISGTSTQAGSFPIQIQVSDSSSPAQLASQSFTLLVNPAAPGTPITSCGTLANAGTTYVLQNDVSSIGTCFTISANNITFDLNGHTITYDTGATSSTYGIDANNPSGTHITSSVAGGTVAMSTNCRINLATQSNTAGLCANTTGAILITSGEVDHIFVYDYGNDNEAIRLSGTSASVHDNTICPYHTKSLLTHYANYAEIHLQGAGGPTSIYNNLVGIPASTQYPNGCPARWTDPTGAALTHGYGFFGIQLQNWNSGTVSIHDNVISMAAPVRDAYGIGVECTASPGPSATIYNNTINQYGGRGIIAAGWNGSSDPGCGTVLIHDNHVTIKEAENEGYTEGDPIGIQFRFGQHGSQIYNNTITVNVGKGACPAQFFTDTGSDCNGIGVKIIGGGNGVNNQIYNNTIVADSNASSSLSSQCCWSEGLYGNGTSDSATSFSGNTVTSNSFNASVTDTDGCGSGWIFQNNTFIEDTNPQGYGTFRVVWFCNSGGPSNNILLDNTYQGGAGSDNIGGSGSDPYSYFVKWSLNVSVKDTLGNAVSGASVSAVATGGGTETVKQNTDSSGNTQLILTDHSVSGTSATAPSVVAYTPHTVTVSKALCTTVSASVQLRQSTTLPITLSCQ